MLKTYRTKTAPIVFIRLPAQEAAEGFTYTTKGAYKRWQKQQKKLARKEQRRA